MVDLVLALGLLSAAAALLWYVVTLLVRAAGSPLSGLIERRRVARSVAHARAADRWIADGDVPRALAAIRVAFYLRPVANAEIASAVANHHTGLLSRLLALTADGEHGTVRLFSLARVDRLLTERAALQRRLPIVASGGAVASRRELEADIRRNADELARALDMLVGEVLAGNGGN